MRCRKRTVAHVIRDLLLFIKDIKGKPALMQAADSSFILDRVRDLCLQENRKELAITALPDEIMQRCLGFLEPEDMLAVGRVCRTFLKLANYSEHWRVMLPLQFPVPRKKNFDYRNCYLRMRNKPNRLEALSPSIEIRGLRAVFIGSISAPSGVLVTANRPIKLTSPFYFEVHIENAESSKVSIGLACEDYPQMHPGYYHLSYAYHSDCGSIYRSSEERDWGPAFDDGDSVGCGFDCNTRTIFFTKNGELLGRPFGVDVRMREKLYPVIGLQTTGQAVRVELGTDPEAFRFPIYDLDDMEGLIDREFESEPDSHSELILSHDQEEFHSGLDSPLSSGIGSGLGETFHWDASMPRSDNSDMSLDQYEEEQLSDSDTFYIRRNRPQGYS